MIHLGNNLEILRKIETNTIDSCVTDPPYGLSFMNKHWDYDVPTTEFWSEVLRVLKPGAHVLSFGGTRTYHRMVVNIEDAGFEIRDQLQWLYGSGFPKSYNISKGIDKKFGAEREVVGKYKHPDGSGKRSAKGLGLVNTATPRKKDGEWNYNITTPSTDLAKQWDGFGTALKPSNEPIVLARKPLSEKTIVDNVLKWGTGGLNIDGCRVATNDKVDSRLGHSGFPVKDNKVNRPLVTQTQGRFPANTLFDYAAAEMLDEQSGVLKSGKITPYKNNGGWKCTSKFKTGNFDASEGGASRFFYVAKASKRERGEGNAHPTVKPIKLMQYLVRLITPPGGTVIDPFMGSGTTGIAAYREGCEFIGIELEQEYYDIAQRRISHARSNIQTL